MNTNSRKSNLEALRIIMASAILLFHLFGQSGALELPNSKRFLFVIGLGSGGRVACAVFVMIGAYFLVDIPFKMQRILRLWLKAFIVAICVNGIVFLVDPTFVSSSQLSGGGILSQFFPIFGKPYWFITEYIILLIVSPFLNQILHSENLQRYLKGILLIILAAISVLSFFPRRFNQTIFINDFFPFVFFMF